MASSEPAYGPTHKCHLSQESSLETNQPPCPTVLPLSYRAFYRVNYSSTSIKHDSAIASEGS